MSHRKQQVEATLKRAISSALTRQIADPRITGMVTVTQVDVSPDLHHAKVMVSVIPEKFQKRTIHGLRSAASHIHGVVCKAVRMRTVPHLDFRVDDSIKKQAEVLAAIRRAVGGQADEPDSEGLDPAEIDINPDLSKPETPAP